jgi:hypothetical protein
MGKNYISVGVVRIVVFNEKTWQKSVLKLLLMLLGNDL